MAVLAAAEPVDRMGAGVPAEPEQELWPAAAEEETVEDQTAPRAAAARVLVETTQVVQDMEQLDPGVWVATVRMAEAVEAVTMDRSEARVAQAPNGMRPTARAAAGAEAERIRPRQVTAAFMAGAAQARIPVEVLGRKELS